MRFILVWWEYDKIEYRQTVAKIGSRYETDDYRDFIALDDII